MKNILVLVLFVALFPSQLYAESKKAIFTASDGFPVGQDSAEGAAADFARAFILNDAEGLKKFAFVITLRAHQVKNTKDFC